MIYLKGRGGDRIFIHRVTYHSGWFWARPKSGAPKLLGLLAQLRGSRYWAIFHCFPRHISIEEEAGTEKKHPGLELLCRWRLNLLCHSGSPPDNLIIVSLGIIALTRKNL